MNLCVRPSLLRSNLISSLYRLSTTATTPPEVLEQNETVIFADTDESRAREREIEKKRNISRLSAAHYNITHGKRPYAYEAPRHTAHLTVKWSRKMYGKYGIESGVNPSLCWPTKKDIKIELEYESVKYPNTIQEMIVNAAENRKAEREAVEQREREIEIKFGKLAHWKKDLADRIAKKEAETRSAKEKKERLVEEVRRHFGFKLDPRDERFQEMLAKREKEQKKLEKLARREAKEKAIITKMQQTNATINANS